MAPRPATAVESLREIGHYIDAGLHPTLNELPALFTALVEDKEGVVSEKVQALRAEGAGDVEISQQVAHLIAPPDPDAGAVHVQGVPQEQVTALQQELAALKELVAGLHSAQAPPTGDAQVAQQAAEQQAAQQAAFEAQQAELAELRQLVQSLSIASASQQHPTAESVPGEQP